MHTNDPCNLKPCTVNGEYGCWSPSSLPRLTSVTWKADAGVAALAPHACAMITAGAAVAQVHLCVTLIVFTHPSKALQTRDQYSTLNVTGNNVVQYLTTCTILIS